MAEYEWREGPKGMGKMKIPSQTGKWYPHIWMLLGFSQPPKTEEAADSKVFADRVGPPKVGMSLVPDMTRHGPVFSALS